MDQSKKSAQLEMNCVARLRSLEKVAQTMRQKKTLNWTGYDKILLQSDTDKILRVVINLGEDFGEIF